VPLLFVLILVVLPEAVAAQGGLPSYSPINPVAASRIGLSFEPYRSPRPHRWAVSVGLDYASTIESNQLEESLFLLDSELLRLRAAVSRDLGTRTFVLAEAELLGAYAGRLDGFLEWYHDLLGIAIPERDRRPRNEFLFVIDLPGRAPVLRERSDLFLGDLRLGAGFRIHPSLQSIVSLTLPTSTGPEGYGRGVVSARLLNTVRLALTPRLVFEGSLSGGFAPTHGELAQWQREVAVAASSGARWRFWGRQSLYGNLFLHSSQYRDTGLPSLDRRELSFDFGWILTGSSGRELRVGMTEDLEPGGPAIDLVFRMGAEF
jgi:hypothetical protein